MERTFAIIKPDAFAAGHAGQILARIYAEGFKVVGLKKLYLSKEGNHYDFICNPAAYFKAVGFCTLCDTVS